jgi:hypothetical protein
MDEKLKILIPTDFSVQAEYAYLMVRKLAEKTPVEIHFLHVLNAPDSVTMDSNENIQSCDDIDIQYLVHQRILLIGSWIISMCSSNKFIPILY